MREYFFVLLVVCLCSFGHIACAKEEASTPEIPKYSVDEHCNDAVCLGGVLYPITQASHYGELSSETSVFYLCGTASYVRSVEFTPNKLVENGSVSFSGYTKPVFDIQVLSMEELPEETPFYGFFPREFNYALPSTLSFTKEDRFADFLEEGEIFSITVLQYLENQSLHVGEVNRINVDQPVNPNEKVMLRIEIDMSYYRKISVWDTGNEYYITIDAKPSGICPVAVLGSRGILGYYWHLSKFYDPEVSFEYE